MLEKASKLEKFKLKNGLRYILCGVKGICAGSRIVGVGGVIHVYVDSCKGGVSVAAAYASANTHQKIWIYIL